MDPMPNTGLCSRSKQTPDCTFCNVPKRTPSLLYDCRIGVAREFHLEGGNLSFHPPFFPGIKVQFVEMVRKLACKQSEVLGFDSHLGCLSKMLTILGKVADGAIKNVLHVGWFFLRRRSPHFHLKMGRHAAEFIMKSGVFDDELLSQSVWQRARQFVASFNR